MAFVLMAKHYIKEENIISDLDQIHADLFSIAYEIALNNEEKWITKKEQVSFLESRIDHYDEMLKPLTKFIKLDKTKAGSWCNVIRVTSRRAEREMVSLALQQNINTYTLAYLNRLSDYMFTLGRFFDEV